MESSLYYCDTNWQIGVVFSETFSGNKSCYIDLIGKTAYSLNTGIVNCTYESLAIGKKTINEQGLDFQITDSDSRLMLHMQPEQKLEQPFNNGSYYLQAGWQACKTGISNCVSELPIVEAEQLSTYRCSDEVSSSPAEKQSPIDPKMVAIYGSLGLAAFYFFAQFAKIHILTKNCSRCSLPS